MRSSYLKSTFLFLLAIFLLSCEDENLNDIAANQFVIEAFLYAGEPIDDIRIKSTYPLAAEEDTSAPINDATVTLIKQGTRYDLVASGNEGYYHYPGSDLTVATNDVFQLEVIHNGITATSETRVPAPTTGLELSEDTVFVPSLPFQQGQDSVRATIANFIQNSRVQASWNNPNGDFYFMVVESLSEQSDPIFPDVVVNALERFRFVSEPTDENSLTFISGTLVSFGTYVVKVYHINEEYRALYENQEQDSRDLNEPPSNIFNALGVFSAFNSEEAFFELAREE